LKTTHPPTHMSYSCRTGLTLLEVVLSLALLSLLIGAVYQAIVVYTRLSTAGRHEVQQAQVVRAVFARIQRDLRGVVYRGDEASANGDEIDLGTAAESSTTAAETTGGVAAGHGIQGTSDGLIVFTQRPASPYDTSVLGGAELLSVSWFLATPNASGLAGAVGDRAAAASGAGIRETSVQGIARLAGDRTELATLDEMGDEVAMAAMAEVLAPEVNYLAFRYYDGTTWVDTWNSDTSGLPAAVEVTLGCRPAEREGGADSQRSTNGLREIVSNTYRLVVDVPGAQPAAFNAGESELIEGQ